MSISAIIVAAGSSRRMGFDKLSALLLGKAVLLRTVEVFCAAPSIDEVFVVCPKERFADLLEKDFPKPVHQVEGGTDRQDSVENGLHALPQGTTIVAVHDGARPMLSVDAIEECIQSARQNGASTLARRVTETLKRSDSEGFVRSGVDRDNLWFMETPQCFEVNILQRAYMQVRERNQQVTDEVSAVELLGISTHIVESRKPNIKITLPNDLDMAAYFLNQENTTL
jgi:2-C-methyl-D-erythritol 4-phosphate cytidylyltransferase